MRLALWLTLSLTACSSDPSVESICQREGECGQESQAHIDKCIFDGHRIEQTVEKQGCVDAWHDYLDCVDENLTCVDGGYDISECDDSTYEKACR
jgi:hypothetical protein